MKLLFFGPEFDLARLQRRELQFFDIVTRGDKEGEDADSFDQHFLPVVVLGLGGPFQERGHVLGYLAGSGWGAILILNDLIVQRLRHGNGAAGEVRVVVLTFSKNDTSRGVAVPS